MRIVLGELKKIFSWRIIFVLMAFSAMYFMACMYFDIDCYPNGHPATEDVEYSSMLTQKYGVTLERDEFEEFYTSEYEKIIHLADTVIANDTGMAEVGLHSYKDLVNMRNNTEFWSEKDNAVINSIYNDPKNNYTLYKLDALENLKSNYYLSDNNWSSRLSSITNTKAIARWQELRYSNENLSVIPWSTISNLTRYTLNLAILIALAMLILLSPLITSDRVRKLQPLQYSSKQGRKLLGKQFMAILLSSVILTTVLILIFGGIYTLNKTQVFWGSYVSSFNSMFITTIPITFGQYIMIMIGMLYLWGLVISMVAFILSRFCSNYIALIAGVVSVSVAAILLCNGVIFAAPLNHWFYDVDIALFEPIICTVLLMLGTIAAIRIVQREKKIEIV